MDNFLSVTTIADELNMGKATIKFILKRFKNWIPSQTTNGQYFYPNHVLTMIANVQEKLDMGILPSQIEEQLKTQSTKDKSSFTKAIQNDDIRLSHDGLTLLKSVFSDIGEQQKRIAKAHEKRADAEERKAVAIEKRAEAEEKKAEAMNNIANALQEMNKIRTAIDPSTQQIAHQAVSIIVEDEQTIQTPSLESQEEPPCEGGEGLINEEHLDDLASLIEEDDLLELDDLSSLINEPFGMDIQIDDLSKLIDVQPSGDLVSEQLDDLSLLINAVSSDAPENEEKNNISPELDDLSKLLEDNSVDISTTDCVEMDDLSLLVDLPDSNQNGQDGLDDLSLLIDAPAPDMDDLSKLIDKKELIQNNAETKSFPEIKIDVSPDQDLGKYKAAIMKVIIGLKTDGIAAEETTDILNKNDIKTLSGKPKWTEKSISQIYKFIESAS